VAVKVQLEFKLLSARKIAGAHLLTLNLKNVGSSILKNLVVTKNHSALSSAFHAFRHLHSRSREIRSDVCDLHLSAFVQLVC